MFGDTFRDRADDYLYYEPPVAMPDQVGLEFKDALPVQDRDAFLNLPDEFEVPRPAKLVAELEEPEVVSLSEYQGIELNPRLERDGAGTMVLRMDGRYAVAWTAVSEVLKEASFKVDDLNRSIGTYYISLEKLQPNQEQSLWDWLFGGEEELVVEEYLLKMHRSRLGVYLSLQKDIDNLADEALTETVLVEIKDLLLK